MPPEGDRPVEDPVVPAPDPAVHDVHPGHPDPEDHATIEMHASDIPPAAGEGDDTAVDVAAAAVGPGGDSRAFMRPTTEPLYAAPRMAFEMPAATKGDGEGRTPAPVPVPASLASGDAPLLAPTQVVEAPPPLRVEGATPSGAASGVASGEAPKRGLLAEPATPRSVLVLGTGPLAVAIAEIFEFLHEYTVIGLVDDSPDPTTGHRKGLPLVGRFDDLASIAAGFRRLYGAVGFEDNTRRRHLFHRLVRAGLHPASAIHPRSSISTRAVHAPGLVAMSGVVIAAGVVLGDNVVLSANAHVGHACRLGDHVHVFPGAVLMEGVKVGSGACIGPNAIVNPELTVGEGTYIGSGAVVTRDLPENVVAYGNPARVVRKRNGTKK